MPIVIDVNAEEKSDALLTAEVLMKVPNQAMRGVSVAALMREAEAV